MAQYFDNRNEAISHLTAHGWRQTKSGVFVNRENSQIADICSEIREVVVIQTWEKGE